MKNGTDWEQGCEEWWVEREVRFSKTNYQSIFLRPSKWGEDKNLWYVHHKCKCLILVCPWRKGEHIKSTHQLKKENQLFIKWPRQEAKISRKLIRQLWLKKKFRLIKNCLLITCTLEHLGIHILKQLWEGNCRGKQK